MEVCIIRWMKPPQSAPFGDFGPHKSGKPVVPARTEEFIWLGGAALGFAAIAILAGYMWVVLLMPEATWPLIPMAALPACFVWRSYRARKKRIAAAEALARYEAMMDRIAAEF